MRKTLIINSLSGGVQLLISTSVVLVAVPIFIQKLGIEIYGVFSLMLIINNLNYFLGLGINTGLIKFLSEQGRTKESDIDILTAYIFLIVILLPFSILGFFFNGFILKHILNIPIHYINKDTLIFFNFLLIANFIQFLGQVPASVLDTLQKIYLGNIYQSIYQFLYWGLIIVSIFIYGSMKMIGASILLSAIIWFLLLFGSSVKFWNYFDIETYGWNMFQVSLKKQIAYNYKLYLGNLINFFYEPLTKLLISNFLGIYYVGMFDIILRIRTQIWNLISKLLYPLYPFLSQLKDKLTIRNVIHDIEQKLAYIIVLLIIIVIFTVPDFINIWLNNDSEILITGMILILSSNLIAIVLMPLYQFLMLKGYPEKTIVLQSLNVLLNLFVFFLFHKQHGFFAVIWGNALAIIGSTVLSAYYQKKYLNSLIFDSFKQILNIILLFLFLFFAGYILALFISGPSKLIILPLVLFLLFIGLIRTLLIITKEDIMKYSGSNIKLFTFLSKIFLKRNIKI